MMESYSLVDAATGARMEGDYDPNDPMTYFSPAGRAAENAGDEGSKPGWTESRYFSERPQYEAFKASGQSLEDYFHSAAWASSPAGRQWNSIEDEDREREIYRAGQRIQHTYKGDPEASDPEMTGTAQTYYTATGRARFEAEKRLGIEPGSLY